MSQPPETVLIAGTGAVDGSWNPVRNALLKFFPLLPEGQENLAFAVTINNLRHMTNVLNGGIRVYGLKYLRHWLLDRKKMRPEIKNYNALKKEIAQALQKSQDDSLISVRQSVLKVKESWIDQSNNYSIITTNWDLMLETIFPNNKVFHIHGDIRDFRTLYLPTEQSWEPYRYFDNGKFSAPEQARRITHANWLVHKVKRLIILGLSISPLDPELNQLFWSSVYDNNIDEVVIIDPDSQIISERLKFHVGNKATKINMILPTEL